MDDRRDFLNFFYLGLGVRDRQCDHDGERSGEETAVGQQLSRGEGHGEVRAGEAQPPHAFSPVQVHPWNQPGGVPLQHEGQQIQRDKAWRQKKKSLSFNYSSNSKLDKKRRIVGVRERGLPCLFPNWV